MTNVVQNPVNSANPAAPSRPACALARGPRARSAAGLSPMSWVFVQGGK